MLQILDEVQKQLRMVSSAKQQGFGLVSELVSWMDWWICFHGGSHLKMKKWLRSNFKGFLFSASQKPHIAMQPHNYYYYYFNADKMWLTVSTCQPVR